MGSFLDPFPFVSRVGFGQVRLLPPQHTLCFSGDSRHHSHFPPAHFLHTLNPPSPLLSQVMRLVRRREELLGTGAYGAGDALVMRIQTRVEELMRKGGEGLS